MANRNLTEKTRGRYNRQAWAYDLYNAPMEMLGAAAWRRKLAKEVRGARALEVGVGTGKNLAHYHSGPSYTAIDLSPRMLKRARAKAADMALNVNLKEMDVQNLAFPNECFDTVFATFVFCSVPDPVAGLKELRRVCKPEGRLLLLEHVRPMGKLAGAVFDVLNPMVVRMMGANINRPTLENIEKAGWQPEAAEHLSGGVVYFYQAKP